MSREELSVSRNGSFVFTTGLLSGAVYNVTVNTQPTAPVQNCTVTNASGTMGSAGVADVVETDAEKGILLITLP